MPGIGVRLRCGGEPPRKSGKPTLVSATVNSTGTSLTTVWSKAVTGTTADGLTLHTAAGTPTLTYASGSGTTTLVHTIGAAVLSGDTVTLDCSGSGLTPSPASFSGASVTNNSTQVAAAFLPTIVKTTDVSNYTETGSGWSGFGSISRYHATGSGTNKAKWKFTGLTAGSSYQIAGTWDTHSSWTTACPYKIYDSDGTTVLKSGTFNENQSPTQSFYFGQPWQNINTATPTGTVLYIEITDQATGTNVVAGQMLAVLAAAPAPIDYSLAASGVSTQGVYTDTTAGGRRVYQMSSNPSSNVGVTAKVTGRVAALNFYYDTSAVVLVDGSVATPVINGQVSGGFGYVALDLGTDAAHDISLFTTYTDYTHGIQVSGASPSIGYASGYSAASYFFKDSPSFITVDNSGVYSSNGYGCSQPAVGVTNSAGTSVRFKATCSRFRLFGFYTQTSNGLTGNHGYKLLVDGVDTGAEQVAPASGFGWLDFSGLDAGAEHEYTVVSGVNNNNIFIQLVILGSINTTPITSRLAWAFTGDSITEGLGLSDTTRAWPRLAAFGAASPRGCINTAVSGTVVTQSPYYGTFPAGLSSRVDRVISAMGHNDVGNGSAQTQYGTMLANILAGVTAGTKVYQLGCLPYTGQGASRTTLNAALQAAVTAQSNANCIYLNTDSWIDPSTDTVDGTHPNASGNAKIAAAFLAAAP